MSKKKPEPAIYSSAEVAKYANIPMRQLDYWTQRGWLLCDSPPFTVRKFTETMREKARAMHFLDGIGFVESEASREADWLMRYGVRTYDLGEYHAQITYLPKPED